MFFLFWAAIPFVIAAVVASNNGQSVGVALLLTLALGWIGLLVVVLLGRRDPVATTQAAIDRLTAPPARPPAMPVAEQSTANDIVRRLARLDQLRAAGTITDEEYAERRRAVLADT